MIEEKVFLLSVQPKHNEHFINTVELDSELSLTFKRFGGRVGGARRLWNNHALPKHLDIKACIVKRNLGVFLQLLGQVGSGCGGHRVGPVAAILRDLQLFHKTHRSARKVRGSPKCLDTGGRPWRREGLPYRSTLSELEVGSAAEACSWTCLSWFLFSLAAAAMGQPDRLKGSTFKHSL